MQRGFCSDVNTARRFVENEQPGLSVKLFAQHYFLLVAAGEPADLFTHGRSADREPLAVLLGRNLSLS